VTVELGNVPCLHQYGVELLLKRVASLIVGKTGGKGDDVAGGGAGEDSRVKRAVGRKTADLVGARAAAAATPVTRAPTNSLSLPDSIFCIPRTADKSVKNFTPSRGDLSDYFIFLASLTELTAATNSILGIVIFTFGAT
jgi:hypothetical protein